MYPHPGSTSPGGHSCSDTGPEPANSTSSPFGLTWVGSSGRCTMQAALCLEDVVLVLVTGTPGCRAAPLVGRSPLTGEQHPSPPGSDVVKPSRNWSRKYVYMARVIFQICVFFHSFIPITRFFFNQIAITNLHLSYTSSSKLYTSSSPPWELQCTACPGVLEGALDHDLLPSPLDRVLLRPSDWPLPFPFPLPPLPLPPGLALSHDSSESGSGWGTDSSSEVSYTCATPSRVNSKSWNKNIENNTNKNNVSNHHRDVVILFDVMFILIQLGIIPVITYWHFCFTCIYFVMVQCYSYHLYCLTMEMVSQTISVALAHNTWRETMNHTITVTW